VGILGVAGVRETMQLASIENARSLDCAQVSDSVIVQEKGGRIASMAESGQFREEALCDIDTCAMVTYHFNRRLWQGAGNSTW
jgi:hypothetical protein